MKKEKKMVTSVTIDPSMKKADEHHINYSEAFEKGLKILFELRETEDKRKKKIEEQREKKK